MFQLCYSLFVVLSIYTTTTNSNTKNNGNWVNCVLRVMVLLLLIESIRSRCFFRFKFPKYKLYWLNLLFVNGERIYDFDNIFGVKRNLTLSYTRFNMIWKCSSINCCGNELKKAENRNAMAFDDVSFWLALTSSSNYKCIKIYCRS